MTIPQYGDLDTYDVVDKLSILRQKGWWWDRETGKISCNAGFSWDHVWLMIRREKHRNCKLWHEILFGMFQAMPPFCMECWKVVARPKTVVDMFRCVPLMEELKLPSKIGCSPRRNTFGLYQAYFYNDSLEEAKEVEGRVRDAFDLVDPNMDIYTKRFCSEFEEKFGPSDKAEVTKRARAIGTIIEDLVDYPVHTNKQPKLLRERIMKEWIIVAMQSGDTTYLQCNGGKPLHLEAVRY